MHIPTPTKEATELFTSLAGSDRRLVVREVFGQPTAFVNGNMCFGAFGEDVFFRLSQADRAEAAKLPGTRPFEPMAGRPMREYVILPRKVLLDRTASRRWLERSVEHVAALPPKKSGRTR